MTQPERMARLEEKVDNVDVKVDGLDAKLDKLIDSLDGRYASKLTERIVYGLVGIILVGVFGALLGLVLLRPTIITHPTGSTTTATGTTTTVTK